MQYSTMRRVGAPALVVMASLAFAVPVPAAVRPDDRAGLRAVGAESAPIQVRPDDRSGFRGVGVTAVLASARPDDRAGFRGTDQVTASSAVAQPLVMRIDNGFDWGAAGAGAAGATGLLLLLTGAALMLRRTHRRAGIAA